MLKNNQKNKEFVWDFWQRLNHASIDEVPGIIRSAFHEDINWNGPHPINHVPGIDALIADFWLPLKQSFPNLKRKTDIFLGGVNGGEEWVTGLGYLSGTFAKDWLGIPATGKETHIHFGQFYLMRDGRIAESYVVLDLLAVIRQAGFQILPPGLGAEGGKVSGPYTRDGVLLVEQDPLESRKTSHLVKAMLDGLFRYKRDRDGQNMDSMEQEHYWHPQMHWYGPTGIGTCRNFQEFIDFQMRPWMTAFGEWPDLESSKGRTIGMSDGEVLAEGYYSALGVWDVDFSFHHGDYLGFPATGKLVTLRDFDWYRRDGHLLVQNWIPIDLIDLFMQFDVDIFALLHRKVEARQQGHRWYGTIAAGQ